MAFYFTVKQHAKIPLYYEKKKLKCLDGEIENRN